MSIGSFGKIVFTASDSQVKTFSDLQQQNTARYAEHEIIGKKPMLEFLGPGLEEITFSVQLMAHLGVNPDAELKTLQEMRDAGEVGTLVFGETKIAKFVLTGISSTEGPRDKFGLPTWIEVSLTLREYIDHEDE